jgi:threonine dehydratase
MTDLPDLSHIQKALQRIKPYIHRTPVLQCKQFSERAGADVYFKCENFQKVGAFKFRGASNTVFSLTEEQSSKGVATHSSGNHAQAVALAARMRGIPAYIVMPGNAPRVKKEAVAGYGGVIHYCEPTLQAREDVLNEVMNDTGAYYIPSYDDKRIVTGQGTATLELLEDHPDLDYVLAPVGGGGLLSGTSIAAKGIRSDINVIGAEPEAVNDAYQSFKSGKLQPATNNMTIADGLRTSLSDLTFSIISKNVDDIITVSESSIIKAMRFIWERMKIIIEPSSAVPVAVLMNNKLAGTGEKIGIIISGGNVDLDKLPWQ